MSEVTKNKMSLNANMQIQSQALKAEDCLSWKAIKGEIPAWT